MRKISSTTCSSWSSIWEAVGWYLLLKYWGILGKRKNKRKQMFHKQPNLNNSLIFKFKPKWFLLRKIFSYYYSLLLIFVVNLTKRIIRGDTKLSGNIFLKIYILIISLKWGGCEIIQCCTKSIENLFWISKPDT